uniref:Retrovirus-related Pol polyprotein from transposon TNT 1-94 n=1 Tax=Cajanus cajan TaxID=3821 RepID=A0A151TMF2_CAJCA|nr:hypothetical protein KK1_021843 [Cajanus cajan]
MSKQDKRHWDAVKKISKYLKSTISHGIMFGSQQGDPLVMRFVDSDYTGDLDDKRSTT